MADGAVGVKLVGDTLAPVGDVVTLRMEERRLWVCACGEKLEQVKFGAAWVPSRCEACTAKAEREEAREREERERARRLEALHVPDLYREAALDNFVIHGEAVDQEKQRRCLEMAQHYIESWGARRELPPPLPLIAVFTGCPGSGKGHTAWSIAKAIAVEYGERVLFTVLSDVIRDLREAWDRGDEGGLSEAARLRRYRQAGLLIIDEVSTGAFYGRPTQHLYDLVVWREDRMLPTIITTNERGGDLAGLLGRALTSRVLGWGKPWDFGDSDYRVLRQRAWR